MESQPICNFFLRNVAALCPTDSKVYVCDFHREKAWWEWLSNNNHGISHHIDEVLEKMRCAANAVNEDAYTIALHNLRAIMVWKESAKLQAWFTSTWLCVKEVSCIIYK